MDISFVSTYILSIIIFALTKYMLMDYPLESIQCYLEFIAFYLCFRLKYCTRISINVLFRLHLFSFLYSIFHLVVGYLEIVQCISAGGVCTGSHYSNMVFVLVALACAHVVIVVYTCFSHLALNDTMRSNRRGED